MHETEEPEHGIPAARNPVIIQKVRIRAVLGLTSGRAWQVVEERGSDTMAAKPPAGLRPTVALHIIGANHDFVDIFDAEVYVVKSRLAVHAWKRQVSVYKVYVVMIARAVGPPEDSKCALHVRESEV